LTPAGYHDARQTAAHRRPARVRTILDGATRQGTHRTVRRAVLAHFEDLESPLALLFLYGLRGKEPHERSNSLHSRKIVTFDPDQSVCRERDLQQFIDGLIIAEPIKGKCEQPLLDVKAHQPGRHVETHQAGMHPLATEQRREIRHVVGYEHIPSSMARRTMNQSVRERSPSHVTCVDSPWPRLRARATRSGLKHSSTRNFTLARPRRNSRSPKPWEAATAVATSFAGGLAAGRPTHKSQQA